MKSRLKSIFRICTLRLAFSISLHWNWFYSYVLKSNKSKPILQIKCRCSFCRRHKITSKVIQGTKYPWGKRLSFFFSGASLTGPSDIAHHESFFWLCFYRDGVSRGSISCCEETIFFFFFGIWEMINDSNHLVRRQATGSRKWIHSGLWLEIKVIKIKGPRQKKC